MQQLPLILEHRRLLGREDFLVSNCNKEAVEWIDLYPEWNENNVIVMGDKASGKTHIAWLFGEKSGAKIYDISEIEDEMFSDIVPVDGALVIENIDLGIGNYNLEEILFHIINYARECNTKLFFTTTLNLKLKDFKIEDLKTRLLAFVVANIYSPDDEFLKSLLVKQFMERDIIIAPEVIDFTVKNIPRDTMSVKYLVEKSDLLSFEEKRKITIPFIKKIIDEIV